MTETLMSAAKPAYLATPEPSVAYVVLTEEKDWDMRTLSHTAQSAMVNDLVLNCCVQPHNHHTADQIRKMWLAFRKMDQLQQVLLEPVVDRGRAN